MLKSADSTIDASANEPGVVEIRSPDTNLESGLAQLPIDFFDASSLILPGCDARAAGEQRGSFVVAPRGGLPASPEEPLLAFDPLGATDRISLLPLDPTRTRGLAHADHVPTGREIGDRQPEPASVEEMLASLRANTQSLFALRAEALAEAVLGRSVLANAVMLGAALQLGLLPVSQSSLEQAIRDNGIAAEDNLRALRLGRAVVVDPDLAERVLASATPPSVGDGDALGSLPPALGKSWNRLDAALDAFSNPAPRQALRRRLASFAVDLADYQNTAYAERFLERIAALAEAEARCQPNSTALAETGARELYRVMAAKDEYEVARLLMRGPFRRWLEGQRRGRLRLRYQIHPPLLRALGLRRKLALGRWIEPLFTTLIALRRLRGTPFDPFGFLSVRRLDRTIHRWYADLISTLAESLTAENLESAIRIAGLADRIRGYEGIRAGRFAEIQPIAERELAALVRNRRSGN